MTFKVVCVLRVSVCVCVRATECVSGMSVDGDAGLLLPFDFKC